MKFTAEQLAKAKAAKSAEELIALAKENGFELTEEEAKRYIAELREDGELSDEELDNVTGGACQTHSDDTYRDFGYNPGNGQDEYNHPLIVTLGNSCKLSKTTCYECDNRFTSGLTSYCIARSKELDPCK